MSNDKSVRDNTRRSHAVLFAALLGITGFNAVADVRPGTPHLQLAQADNTTNANPASTPSTATIKRVDDKRRKLLLQHGPIENLGMSPMTMGFDVAPGVDITGLNAGDTILFRAEQIKGQYTVTEIRKP
jgi:Cu/Ag efflux protein CusF